MNSLGGSLLLLIVALVLLWLAVTDKLSRVLDAYEVVTGKRSATQPTTLGATSPVIQTPNVALRLPSLPNISHTTFVDV